MSATISSPLHVGPRWRATLRQMSKDEAPGAHHAYVDVYRGETDVRGTVAIRYGWAGMQPEEQPAAVPTDKPAPEPACNIPIWPGQDLWLEVAGEPSDRVGGLDCYSGWAVRFVWE